mmetsp:Transcript_1199/g.3602  ORF Transcript_1199/g.3602 Transcript_1199/m.3602 type:complete len:631 (-) Transcript_1199:54-1946(-)
MVARLGLGLLLALAKATDPNEPWWSDARAFPTAAREYGPSAWGVRDRVKHKGWWSQQGRDIDGPPGFGFGRSAAVSEDGRVVAAGMPWSRCFDETWDPNPGTVFARYYGGAVVHELVDGAWTPRKGDFFSRRPSQGGSDPCFGAAIDTNADGSLVVAGGAPDPRRALVLDEPFGTPRVQRGTGLVKIYRYDLPTGAYAEDAVIDAHFDPRNLEACGASVAVAARADVVAIGCPDYDHVNIPRTGRVVVYEFHAERPPGQQWRIRLEDPQYVPEDRRGFQWLVGGAKPFRRFGTKVDLSADGAALAVGSLSSDGSAASVTRFHWGAAQGETPIWREAARDGLERDEFGVSQISCEASAEAPCDVRSIDVKISGDGERVAFATIGAVPWCRGARCEGVPGLTQVFQKSGNNWGQRLGAAIFDEDFGDRAGASVALSHRGDVLAVGAPGNGGGRGHVRVFHLRCEYDYGRTRGYWESLGQYLAAHDGLAGEAPGDASGTAVALDGAGATLAAGAPLNAGLGGPDSGHVRVSAYSVEPEDLCTRTPYPTRQPTPKPVVQTSRPTEGPGGKSCTDVPSPDMVKDKLTCAEFPKLEHYCSKDKTWTYHTYCQHSCAVAGVGYASVTCAVKDPPKTE